MIRLLFCCFIVMMSCGPAAKLRRAERLISKAEELGAKWRVDSVVTDMPVPIESVRVDTIITTKVGDTVRIEKERLKLKYVRLPGDTIVIMAECAADTIKVKVTKTINKTIEAKGWLRWWHLVLAA